MELRLLLACWCVASADGLATRRVLLASGASSLLLLKSTATPAIDIGAATPVAIDGVGCKTASCQTKVLTELGSLLDIAGVPKNAKGKSSERNPTSVVGKRLQGLKEDAPTRLKIKIAFDQQFGDADNYVQFLWLAEQESGRVLSAKPFTAAASETPPSLAFDGKYTEAELQSIASRPLVVRTYWSGDGLWELPAPFTFADILKGAKGEAVQLF